MSERRGDPIYGAAIGAGRSLFGFLRVKPTVVGAANLPDTGGAVFALTHFGYMDFALAEWMTWKKNRRHVRFLATKNAFDKPVVGFLLRGMRHISVDMTAGAEAYRQAVAALRSGEALGVFPEGGVSASYTVRELKTGAVRMAAEAGVPVIPIAIWGGHRLLTKTAKSSFGEKFGIPVSFAIGEPIHVTAEDDSAAVTLSLRSTLQSLLDPLQRDYPVDGTGQPWQPAHLGGSAPTPEVAAVAEAARKERKAAERAARR
ncbi:1-acyl-sn-glycerol-3-phosphate acyltransferase [Glaciihabitans arcticus]|uniref:1-acyl-sn-glycerol-3-phosphate acyltransferase n=1 Tax=Glaciihabitans arcticus TaxID=2668039 RepID=A0A4Q9GPA8_9MICO|nr:lysophospholipid acyltransferase family protein [Glaciihabitans arcticus]TBN56525.1 1-acyl-sn-glycerol-3-phosphate acyltransferase [Glaciihabitans arcticus]